jgi:anaerobic magnesium-protoporphyrin IX monomethyl ester cyclase
LPLSAKLDLPSQGRFVRRAYSIGEAIEGAEQIEMGRGLIVTPPRILLIKSFSYEADAWKLLNHPIGLMNLAAYLRRNYQYEVKIEDIRVCGNDRFDLESAIRTYVPDVVGISALTHESDAVPWIAERVKRVNENTPVLLGGPHATAYPQKAVQIPGVDFLVVGEGEIVAGQLVERLLDRQDVSDIKGIVYKKDNRVYSTGKGDFIEDLNDLPMPAYDLIPIEAYGNFARMSRTGFGKYMCIFTSRGCPYHCIYCHNIFGKVFRSRSAQNLFNEIKHLYDTYGIRDFEIMDDIFNLDRERLIDFCDRIINSGMKVTFAFPNGLRGDILDEQQLLKLRQAGTIFIAFAIETGSPRLQKLIKKNIQLDKIKKNIEIAHFLKIHTHGFSMIGFPGETLEEMKMTVDFLVSSKLHSLAMFAVMPFEGTELAAIAKEMGHLPVSDFSMNYWSKKFLNLTDVPSRQVNRIRRQALLRFYLNPSRLFVFARDFPHKRSLGKFCILFFRRLWWHTE